MVRSVEGVVRVTPETIVRSVVLALAAKVREARISTSRSCEVPVRVPAIFPEPEKYKREVASVVSVLLLVKTPAMVMSLPDTTVVPLEIVRALVEALSLKVRLAKISTLLKAEVSTMILPVVMDAPVSKYTVPPLCVNVPLLV